MPSRGKGRGRGRGRGRGSAGTSAVHKRQSCNLEMEASTEMNTDRQEAGPSGCQNSRSSHSSASSTAPSASTIARKRRLELQAAEENAKIRKRAIEEQARLDMELVNRRLAVQLAELEEEAQEPSIGHTLSPYRDSGADVREWLEDTHQEEANQNAVVTTEAATNETRTAQTSIDQLTQVLTQTVSALKANIMPTSEMQKAISRISGAKELPSFGGDSLEWFRFKHSLSVANAMGGYTEEEKLARLYRCLYGEAREAVSSMMLTSADVNQIMETLELRFGNPDIIISKIVQDIRRLPKLNTKNGGLVIFATKVRNSVAAIEAMKHTGYLHSPELSREILNKMPAGMINNYNRFLHERNLSSEPRLLNLSRFLLFEAEIACKAGTSLMTGKETRTENFGESSHNSRVPFRKTPRASINTTVDETGQTNAASTSREHTTKKTDQSKCGYCGDSRHLVTKCPRFKSQTIERRWEWAKKEGVCFRCLIFRHRANQCRAKACQQQDCRKTHNTLLHPKGVPQTSTRTQNPPCSSSGSESNRHEAVTNTWVESDQRILLKVAPIMLRGPTGSLMTYALLDEGSTVTLIDADVANAIGAQGPRNTLALQGAGTMNSKDVDSRRVSITIGAINGGPEYDITNARTFRGLSLPCQEVRKRDIMGHKHLTDIEIVLYANIRPTLLIGQDNCHLLIPSEIRCGSRSAPVASRTKLGWIIHGYAPGVYKQRSRLLTLQIKDNNNRRDKVTDAAIIIEQDRENERDLHKLVKSYFETDVLGFTNSSRINEALKRAELLLDKTTRRVSNRWETGLLWKNENIRFPNNYENAKNRLYNLERRLDKDPAYGRAYEAEIKNLIDHGYACK